MICVMKSSSKIVWKTKITFLLSKTFIFFFQQKIYFVLGNVLKIPKDLIASEFFCWANTEKHRYTSTKASGFVDCGSKFRALYLKFVDRLDYYWHQKKATVFDINFDSKLGKDNSILLIIKWYSINQSIEQGYFYKNICKSNWKQYH